MTDATELLALTTHITASYVENNKTPADQLPALIASIHAALSGADAPAEQPAEAATASKAQIRKSITDAALISFEDGKPYKMLKRHLTTLGLTPAQYREKWGLPSNYPMTAASYSATRSAHAKSIGLGQIAATKKPSARRKPKA